MGVLGRIDDLQPFAELARGPSTIVYKAYQASTGRPVLLKVLRADVRHDEERVRRFEGAAALAAGIRHPNVVAVYAHGREAGQVYLATEFVEGFDGRVLLSQGPMPPELAACLVREAARGLQAAHARGVLHRDLKPSNLLVAQDGTVKLTDFGMASLAGEDGAEVRGTAGYLAPELVRGERPTPASDLFSLGATFYEALAGRPAFVGAGTGELLNAVLHHDPMPVLDRLVELPADLRTVCARLLAREPDRRYPDASTLLTDLDAFFDAHGITGPQDALRRYLTDPAAYQPMRLGAETPQRVLLVSSGPVPSLVRRFRLRAWWVAGAALLVVLAVGMSNRWPSAERPLARPSVPPGEQVGRLLPLPSNADSSRRVAASVPDAVAQGTLATTDDEARVIPPDIPAPAAADTVAADTVTVRTPSPEDAAASVLAPATLHIVVAPWADVYVDERLVGRTPLPPMTLPAGRHRITLKHPQFPSAYVEDLEVQPGLDDTLNVALWERVGQVWLIVSPWAEVRIDGVVRDTLPPQERPLVVTPGEHTLALRHPDLGTWETTFTVAAGDTLERRYNLYRLLNP